MISKRHHPNVAPIDNPRAYVAREGGQCDCACQPAGSVLSVWLHVTDRCNLRCAYCYLPHAPSNMTLETGQAAIQSAFRSALLHGYKTLKLKYAGGEPLLCFPLVVKLHKYAHALALQHGLQLDGVVLSNGTLLTSQIVEEMKSLDLRLMISMDGLDEYHDCHRFRPNGSGSFEAVSAAVETACSGGLVPDICITISNRNALGLAGMVSWVLEKDLPFSVNFYRANSLSSSQADLALEEKHVVQAMLAAFKVIEEKPPKYNLLPSLMDRTNLAFPHDHPCSVGQDYLVFDSHGSVAKCQMDMEHPVTDFRASDPLGAVRASHLGLVNPAVEEKEECASCEWRYYCAGGCPLQAFQTGGSYENKSPNCGIYKALFPDMLRLEQLRLQSIAQPAEAVSQF